MVHLWSMKHLAGRAAACIDRDHRMPSQLATGKKSPGKGRVRGSFRIHRGERNPVEAVSIIRSCADAAVVVKAADSEEAAGDGDHLGPRPCPRLPRQWRRARPRCRNSGPCARLQPKNSRPTLITGLLLRLSSPRTHLSPSSARIPPLVSDPTAFVTQGPSTPMVGGRATVRPPSQRSPTHRRSRRRSPAIGARSRSEDAVAPPCELFVTLLEAWNGLALPRRPRTNGGPRNTAPGVGLRHGDEARRSRAPDTGSGASVPRKRLLIRQVGVHPWRMKPTRALTDQPLIQDAARLTSSK